MRAPRLLSLLLLLQAHGRLSARALAERLEVSERTVYRDVDALAEAGVPVYAERGSRGGIVLAEGYRRALSGLGEDEVRALFVSRGDPLADLGFAPARAHRLEGLLGSLPQAERDATRETRRRVLIDHRRWYQGDPPAAILALLREAAWGDRRLDLQYRDRYGAASERIVDPLGLVAKTGIWYLVARSGADVRTFRVDRVTSAVIRPERFARPPDFDLETYWHTSRRALEARQSAYWITLRMAPHRYDDLASLEHEVVDRDAGIVRVNLASASDAAWRLFGWSDAAEVIAPRAFVEALVANARATIARYAASLNETTAASSFDARSSEAPASASAIARAGEPSASEAP